MSHALQPDPRLGPFIDAIWGRDSNPVVSVQPAENHGTRLIRLRDYQHRSTDLPQYITPATPKWWDGDPRKLEETRIWAGQARVDEAAKEGRQLFSRVADNYECSNLLVVEIDYLLVPRKGSTLRWLPDLRDPMGYAKTLQRAAIHQALLSSGFPANALVDSGGKSIHVWIRLDDPLEEIAAKRYHPKSKKAPPEWERLEELLALALGDFDHVVLRQAGRQHYVRTPGAIRLDANGQPVAQQTILHIDPTPTLWQDLVDWCEAQLSDTCRAYLRSRPPVSRASPQWHQHPWRLQVDGWQDLVLRRVQQGVASCGTNGIDDLWHRLNKELAWAGQHKPERLAMPCEAPPYGRWDAPFLWWVQALAINALTADLAAAHPVAPSPEGYVFSRNPWWFQPHDVRTKWPSPKEIEDRFAEKQAKSVSAEGLLVASFLHAQESGLPPPRSIEGGKPPPVFASTVEPWEDPRLVMLQERIGKPLLYVVDSQGGSKDPWRIFDTTHWKHYPHERMEAHARSVLEILPYQTAKGQPKELTLTSIKELLHKFRDHHPDMLVEAVWQSKENAVAFKNGTVYFDLKNRSLEFRPKHDPDDRLRNCVGYDYQEDCPTPLFDDFMWQIFPNEIERQLSLEYMGSCFCSVRMTKDFLICHGPKDTGKSTYVSLVEMLVGTDNAASFHLDQLAEPHALEPLVGKQLIYDPDASDALLNRVTITSRIKAITGNDRLSINPKGVAIHSEKVYAKLIIGCNEKPSFRDGSDALWERAILLPFDQRVPDDRKNPLLLRTIQEQELPGIAVKAMKGYIQVLTRPNGPKYVVSERMKADNDEYREASDPIISFFNEYIVDDEAVRYVYAQAVYECFCQQAYGSSSGGHGALSFGRWLDRVRRNNLAEVRRPHDSSKVTAAQILYLPQNYEFGKRLPWMFTGIRCTHPRVRPLPPLADRGTVRDTRTIPFPRKEVIDNA